MHVDSPIASRLELFRHWKRTGDANTLEQLCRSLFRLVEAIVRQRVRASPWICYDDAMSDALNAMWGAVQRFDESHGSQLGTFVYASVWNSLRRRPHDGPIHIPVRPRFQADADLAARPQHCHAPEMAIVGDSHDMEAVVDVRTAINELPFPQNVVTWSIFIENRTINETSSHLNLNRARVLSARTQAERTLKHVLAAYAPLKRAS